MGLEEMLSFRGLLTFKGFGKSPEVRAAIDMPLRVTRRLRRKRLVAVLTVLAMNLMALDTRVGVRVLLALATEEAFEALLELLEDTDHDCRLI